MHVEQEIFQLRQKVAQLERQVEFLMRQMNVEYQEPADGIPPGVAEALQRGQTLEAIKLYREATGAGLKEAKEYVEALMRRR